MTREEYEWIDRLRAASDLHWDELTDWEKKFMEDLLEGFRQYGIRTKISKKQWEIITRISEKIL
jgi:hypothetical protein